MVKGKWVPAARSPDLTYRGIREPEPEPLRPIGFLAKLRDEPARRTIDGIGCTCCGFPLALDDDE